jgi:hypothetical protein
MLRRALKFATIAGVMGLAPLSSARAVASITDHVCTIGSLTICVDFTLSKLGNHSYSLAVTYLDGAGDDGVLTSFGLYSTSETNPYGIAATSVTSTDGLAWELGCNGLSGGLADPSDFLACAQASPPPTYNGLGTGQTATVYFTTTSGSLSDLALLGERAHIQSLSGTTLSLAANTCSLKIDDDEPNNVVGGSASLAACSTTATPEPGTVFLLATGLLGLAGPMAWKRKRREQAGDGSFA